MEGVLSLAERGRPKGQRSGLTSHPQRYPQITRRPNGKPGGGPNRWATSNAPAILDTIRMDREVMSRPSAGRPVRTLPHGSSKPMVLQDSRLALPLYYCPRVEKLMHIFISWSGKTSHRVALVLHGWLRKVIQQAEPFVSSIDIDKGQNWNEELGDQIRKAKYSIICVTKFNMTSQWLNFEAGSEQV